MKIDRFFSIRFGCFLLTWMVFTPVFAQNWELRKETAGIQVYQRKTPYGYELKLVTTFSHTLSALVALFRNVDDYPRWGYRVQNSRLLRRVSDTEFYYYQQLDFPWPVSDRDVIMRTRIRQDTASRIVTLQSESRPDELPETPGFVRVQKASVRWTLAPLEPGRVQAEYWLSSDPGGLLPDWTVSLASDTGPVQTVQHMKKVLQEEVYRSAKVAFIRN